MKSLIVLASLALEDLGARCHIDDAARDIKTVARRVEAEGDSFLTITLPAFGKDLLRALDEGHVSPTQFAGFRRRQGGLPAFLRGFLGRVFDSNTGVILDDPDIEVIRSLHGFLSMFGKVQRPCAPKRTEAAMRGYVQTDQDVRVHAQTLDASLLAEFTRVSGILFGDLFSRVDHLVYSGEIIPKHGPGATAERSTSNGKYLNSTWTHRLEEYFPAGEFLYPNWGWYHQLQDVLHLPPEQEPPVRVIPVPKTLKTPRIIAIEPVWQQYCQQGLFEALTDGIQRDNLLRSLLGYLDQGPNQQLAQAGSVDGSLATLDLSEASDRVSNRLVLAMTDRFPHLRDSVQACRTRTADVPGEGVIPLAKFASMGSALCFPFEAMVFTTLALMGIAEANHTRVTRPLVRGLVGHVRVYGDDIIVPTHTMHTVVRTIEAFGLVVNRHKSFGAGKFRESCGGDFYAGHRITPVRLRKDVPSSRQDAEGIAAFVAFRNQCFLAGYERVVEFCDSTLRRLLPVYPELPIGHASLGRWVYGPVMAQKLDSKLHTPMVKACVIRSVLPSDPLEGHGALMKFFLKRGDTAISDGRHLQRAGRPESVDIKTRWVPLHAGVTER